MPLIVTNAIVGNIIMHFSGHGQYLRSLTGSFFLLLRAMYWTFAVVRLKVNVVVPLCFSSNSLVCAMDK